jgi:hypothetical protein
LLFSFADKKEQTEVEFLNNLKYHVVDKENKKLLS